MERSNSISSISSNATIRGAPSNSSSNPQPSQSYIKSPSTSSSSTSTAEAHGSSGDIADSSSTGDGQNQTPLRRGLSIGGQSNTGGGMNGSGVVGGGGGGGGQGQQPGGGTGGYGQQRPQAPPTLRMNQPTQPSTNANSPQTPNPHNQSSSHSQPGSQSQLQQVQGFGNYRLPDRANPTDQNASAAAGAGAGSGAGNTSHTNPPSSMSFNFSSGIQYPGQNPQSGPGGGQTKGQGQGQGQGQQGQGQGQGQSGGAQSHSQSQGQGQAQGQTGHGHGQEPWGSPFPSLHLWPLNETFVMKMIALPRDERIKIGRQTNAKTVPAERNAYFDSKVLSRMHAELWEEGGKIYIRDVKSSNGTFINGDRLSGEGIESEPFELKSEDMVEFGIDIVSEDNKSILHHKVSAKAYCVFNVDDAGLSARELTHYYPHDPRSSMGPARRIAGLPGPLSSNSLGPNGQILTSNMLSAGGKIPGLNFDHLLHKLQMELQKSQDTGEELRGLTEAMEGIQETLSGAVPPEQNGSADHHIPPQFRLPPARSAGGVPVVAMGDTTATIAALQAQLSTTQSILVSHKDRIKSLESLLQEHEAIKDEVLGMRRQMEESKHEIDSLLRASEEKAAEDAAKAMAEEAERDDEEQASVSENGSKRGHARERDGEEERSDTPDPGAEEDITDGGRKLGAAFNELVVPTSPTRSPRASGSRLLSPGLLGSREDEIVAQNNALGARLDALSSELEQALQLSRSLHDQHAEATSTVKVLEERVQTLERDVAEKTDAAGKSGRVAEDRWEMWRTKFEDGWRKERESWNLERERLRGVVREWEEASRRAQEEEEERVMNGKLSDDEALLSNSDEDDEDSSSDEEDVRALARTDWLSSGFSGSDQEARPHGSPLQDLPRRSHSASPRSSRSGGKSGRHRPSRRSSSSRLDPAIRALRAAAGDAVTGGKQSDADRKHERFGNGGSTPRTGSPSTADQALGALRNKSARAERAKTITSRGPVKSTDSDGANDGNVTEPPSGSKKGKAKSSLGKAASIATVKQVRKPTHRGGGGSSNDDDNGRERTPVGEGNSTSGESDETAHDLAGEKKGETGSKPVPLKEEVKQGVAAPNPSLMSQNQLPLAISIVVIGVGVWAVLNRAKD